MRDFRHLDAWKKAHKLTLDIYRLTGEFSKSESFGMALTMRRSAASIPTKIAEASSRDTNEAYAAGLSQARSFGMDLEYQLLLARDLQLITDEHHSVLTADIIEARRMLSGGIRHNTQPVFV